jgi:hypothetical protein
VGFCLYRRFNDSDVVLIFHPHFNPLPRRERIEMRFMQVAVDNDSHFGGLSLWWGRNFLIVKNSSFGALGANVII